MNTIKRKNEINFNVYDAIFAMYVAGKYFCLSTAGQMGL